MNRWKRITATISAEVNGLIDQLENHEAVAEVALNDIRDALMNAKFQIKRVQNEQKAFERRIEELQREEEKWTSRALQYKENDQERALECVRRLKRNRDEIAGLRTQLTEHFALERRLTSDIKDIEGKFEQLKHKRSTLAARESRVEAMRAVAGQASATEVGGVFDRWERKVMREEVVGDSSADDFAAKFESEEEKRDLEELLAKLS